MGFATVKQILDQAIATWQSANGQADLSNHGPTFSWSTKAALLSAVGHGKQLIQPNVIGNNQGKLANLVIDLRAGAPSGQMPLGGPFVPEQQVQQIEDWINAGCPD